MTTLAKTWKEGPALKVGSPSGSFKGLLPSQGSIRVGGFKQWGYKSPNMGYNYSYPTYDPTYNYP